MTSSWYRWKEDYEKILFSIEKEQSGGDFVYVAQARSAFSYS